MTTTEREIPEGKVCPTCGVFKAIGEYYAYARYGGIHRECKPCTCERARVYRLNNPRADVGLRRTEEAKLVAVAQRMRREFGITLQQYEDLSNRQGGKCAICRQVCPSGKRLAVDHNHACCPGKKSCGSCIRGLLCTRCNPGLGYFQDDTALLRKAIAYIERDVAEPDLDG